MVGVARSTQMKSACLPSARDPILWSNPNTVAPSMVAMRSTFQAGMISGSLDRILLNKAVSFISLKMLWLLLPGA